MAVYIRGDKGVFYMNFTVNGIRVFRSTGKFTKREAKIVEALEKKKLMDEGSMSSREKRARLKLSEAIDKVFKEKWKHNKDGEGARRNAEIVMEQIGDMPISKIDEDVVAELILKLESRGIKAGTVNRYLAALKTLLRHNRQPWDHIKLKKEPAGRIRVITESEEERAVELFRHTTHPPKRKYYYAMADLVEVLVDTGCRLSEILSITYKDVNFGANLLTSWINKGDKPRSIPMTSRVRGILTRLKEVNTDKPFKINVHQADHAWTWVRKEMGLEGDNHFVIHALRHTCASRLVNAGIDLYVVKEWLGHSSIKMTEKYAHLNPAKLVEAANALNRELLPSIDGYLHDADIDAGSIKVVASDADIKGVSS